MFDTPKISILTRSQSWSSLMANRFCDIKICWALDIDDVLMEVAQSVGRPVVIELAEHHLESDCVKIAAAANRTSQSRFFAVADNWCQPYSASIRSSGFVDVCSSIAEFDHLEQLIRRQLLRSVTDSRSIEQRVRDGLPWIPTENLATQ